MLAASVHTIPDPVISWIRTTGGDHALQLITIDGSARSHIMLMARDEIHVISAQKLRVAVGERSSTAANLTMRTSATLSIYDADLACIIKARVVAGPRPLIAGTVAYELVVEDVRLDVPTAAEGSARLVSGLRFEGRAERGDIRAALTALPS
ncbi:MAG: hypothetical protein ABI672_07320 [Vicinamibacteria bacterium]